MKYFKKILIIIVLSSFFYLFYPQKAYAYLDPGSMSFILQIIIAIIIGGIFGIKLFWKNVKLFFNNFFYKK